MDFDFNSSHFELGSIGSLGGVPSGAPNDREHGTACLGEIRADDNGEGTIGIAFHAPTSFCYLSDDGVNPNLSGALDRCLSLGGGSVVSISLGIIDPVRQLSIPIDGDPVYFNKVKILTGNQITVCEAAGNGNYSNVGENLDDPYYSKGYDPNTGRYAFAPFRPNETDANGVVTYPYQSGAIIVGAGDPSSHARLAFSTYGSRVDMQGWGTGVFTTGYGFSYSAEGPTRTFWNNFNGTSSATPIVAGACILFRSADVKYKAGRVLTPGKVKKKLKRTGTPQPDPYNGNIGPLPNLFNAQQYLLASPPPDYRAEDPDQYPNAYY